MLVLDKSKLERALGSRNLSINRLAEVCGVSRQSIYNMCDETTVFNTTFEKIRKFLGVDYRAITSDSTLAQEILKSAPDRIKIASYILTDFSQNANADLLLFKSEGVGRFGTNHDWSFAVSFTKKDVEKKLSLIRQQLIEKTAPFRVEIVNLNKAPMWLRLVIKDNYVRLYGNTAEETLFYRGL